MLKGKSIKYVFLLYKGERPFQCTLCEKAFNQKSALKVHMKRHTGERPYKCDYCAMGFTQKSNMKLHMKRAHGYTGTWHSSSTAEGRNPYALLGEHKALPLSY